MGREKVRHFGIAHGMLIKVIALCLAVTLMFGSMLTFPVKAEGEVTEADILLLQPNVKLFTDSGGYVEVGRPYAGGLDGSYVSGGAVLTNVQFTIKSDSTIILRESSATGQTGFSTQLVDDHTLVITVNSIGADGASGAVSFAAFDFYIPNRVTPKDQQGSVWIESVRCEDVTVTRDRWDASLGYSNITQTAAIALAENSWSYRAMTISNANYSYQRVLGEMVDGTNVLPISTPPTVTLGTVLNGGTIPSVRYVDTESLEFQAYIQMQGDLGLDPALATTGGLSTDTWAMVHSGGSVSNALFGSYFALSGVGDFDVYAMLDSAYATNHKIYLRFVSSSASIKDIANVQPTLKVSRVYFTNGMTDVSLSGNVKFGYVANDTGIVKYQSYDGVTSSVVDTVYCLLPSGSTATATVQLNRAVDPQVSAQDFLGSLQKAQQAWHYSLIEQGDNLGSTGELYRNFVSAKTVPYEGVSVAMDRIWFEWNLGSRTLPSGIEALRIDDVAGTHYDASKMVPIGFATPNAGTGTTAEVWAVVGGLSQKVWDSAAGLTVVGQTYFEAAASNPAVMLVKSGVAVDGISFVYTAAASGHLTFTGNAKVLFQAKDQGAAVTATENFYNRSRVTLYGDSAMTASDVLVEGEKADTVLYKANFTDEISGGKNVVNVSKGTADITTAGDTLRYTLTVNGPTKETGAGTGVVRALWVMDEHNGTLFFSDPIQATVTVRRANESSTVTPSGMSPTTTSGNTDTYTGVVPYTSGYGITNENQMVFAFSGNFVEGDVITIQYEAAIKEDVEPGNEAVSNTAKYITLEYYGGGGSIFWETAGVLGSSLVGVGEQAAFGDIVIIPTSAQATTREDALTKRKTSFYTEDAINLYVAGGLFGSDRSIHSPAYLVELPSNLVLTNSLTGMTGTLYNIGYSASQGRIFSEDLVIAESAVQFTYYDETGAEVIPGSEEQYQEVRYVRVVFDVTMGNDQMIAFNMPVVATEELTGNGTARTVRAAFLGADNLSESVYRNSLGSWGSAKGEVLSGNSWSTALKDGQSITALDYIQNTAAIRAYVLRNKVNITQIGAGGPLGLDDTGNYTTRVSNSVVDSGLVGEALALDDVVLLLPAGMELVGDTVNAGGTVVTVEKSQVQVVRNARDFTLWRLVIPVNGTVAAGGRLDISYTLKVANLDLLVDGNTISFTDSDLLYASLYYNPNVTGKASASSITEVNATTGAWWDWDTSGRTTGKDRMQASLSIAIQEQRINPGLTVASGSHDGAAFTPADSFENISSPMVDWRLGVYNGNSARFPMKDFVVTMVLPLGIRYTGMIEGPAPTAVYENNEGQYVLYWMFDEATLSQATTNVQDGGLKANANFPMYIRTVGDSSAVGPRMAYAYLIPDQDYFFEQVNVLRGTKVEGFAAINDMEVRLMDAEGALNPASGVQHAVYADKQISLLMRIDATVEKSVANSVGNVSSSSVPRPVYVGRGEEVDFRYTLSNGGTGDPFTNLILYDALPMQGDRNTLIDKPRNSSFALEMLWITPTNAFVITVDNAAIETADYEVFYSAAAAATQSDWEALTTWVEAEEWDETEVTPAAFKIEFSENVTVPSGATLAIEWKMKMPDNPDASLLGGYAYNSAAIAFEQISGLNSYPYCVEPSKCGVQFVGDSGLTLHVSKIYYDALAVNLGTFRFRIEKYDPTLGWQLVPLSQENVASGSVDGTGHITITLNAGSQGTAVLTNLFEGQYRVTEVNVPDGFSVVNRVTELYLNRSNTGTGTLTFNYIDDGSTPPPDGGGGTPPPDDGGEEELPPEVVEPDGGGGGDTEFLPPDPPLGGAEQTWSIVNLICAVIGVLGSASLGVEYLARSKKRKEEEEYGNGNDQQDNALLKILAPILGVLTAVLFCVLEWINGDMKFLTKISWIVIPVFLAGVVVTMIEHRKHKSQDEE